MTIAKISLNFFIIYIQYIMLFKGLETLLFLMFLILCSSSLYLFDLKKKQYCETLLQFKVVESCKAEYSSAITPVFSVTLTFRNHSYMIY